VGSTTLLNPDRFLGYPRGLVSQLLVVIRSEDARVWAGAGPGGTGFVQPPAGVQPPAADKFAFSKASLTNPP
jgi:hypothetical protein